MTQTLLEQWIQKSAQPSVSDGLLKSREGQPSVNDRLLNSSEALPIVNDGLLKSRESLSSKDDGLLKSRDALPFKNDGLLCSKQVTAFKTSQSTDSTALTAPKVKSRQPDRELHSKVTLAQPEKEDIPRLKRLNSLLLPIPYPESFYKEIVTDPVAHSLTLLAFWTESSSIESEACKKGQLIGAIRGRLLNSTGLPGSQGPMLYLSTLVLLSPYRSLGIAAHMLNVLIRRGVQDYSIVAVGAHVWEDNAAGLTWYHNRGFKEVGYDPEYYRKLEPHGARIMSRNISALDFTGG